MRKLIAKGMLWSSPSKLYLDTSMPGGASVEPDDNGVVIVTIGMDRDWDCMVGSLIHECLEWMFVLMGHRYNKTNQALYHSGGYLFSMTHNEFQEAIERAAPFVAGCIAPLQKAWKAVLK